MRSLRFSKRVEGVSNRQKLVRLCVTRWVERHDSVIVFVELLSVITSFLVDEAENASVQDSYKPEQLLAAIRAPAFLIGILTAESVLAHTVGPSQSLQAANCDLVSAFATISRLQEFFEDVRLNAEANFNRLYKKAEQLLQEIGGSEEGIKIPHVCNRQAHRSNIFAETAEVYYRSSVFIPFT